MPHAYSAVRRLIASLVCSLAFLMLVAVAAWIVISSGAGIRRGSNQSEADGGTASVRRSAARFATEAVGNFVLVFAFGVAIATHSWFSPLLIGAPLVAMVYSGIACRVGTTIRR